jgi:hypothetical protein
MPIYHLLKKSDSFEWTEEAQKALEELQNASFVGHIVEWVDRRKNEEANTPARLGSKRLPPPPGVFIDILSHPSVRVPREIDIAEPPAPDSVLVAVVSNTGTGRNLT